MRNIILGMALLAVACGNKVEQRAKADAKAAGFVPPSVTSRVDYSGIQERRFRRLDRNADDVLEREEIPRNPRIRALDRNRDGEITSSEFSEGQINRFDAMDLNKDGSLTSDERSEARAAK